MCEKRTSCRIRFFWQLRPSLLWLLAGLSLACFPCFPALAHILRAYRLVSLQVLSTQTRESLWTRLLETLWTRLL